MNRTRAIVFVSAALAIIAGAVATARPAPSRPARTRHDIAAERALRDSDIAFYQRHAARDPTGALDHLHLAGLYLQRAYKILDEDYMSIAPIDAQIRALRDDGEAEGNLGEVISEDTTPDSSEGSSDTPPSDPDTE